MEVASWNSHMTSHIQTLGRYVPQLGDLSRVRYADLMVDEELWHPGRVCRRIYHCAAGVHGI